MIKVLVGISADGTIEPVAITPERELEIRRSHFERNETIREFSVPGNDASTFEERLRTLYEIDRVTTRSDTPFESMLCAILREAVIFGAENHAEIIKK